MEFGTVAPSIVACVDGTAVVIPYSRQLDLDPWCNRQFVFAIHK